MGSCGKSLFNELEKIHVRAAKIIYGLDWYPPSDQLLAQSKWNTVKDLYEYRLLMLAHFCFYNFLPVAIMKLFTKWMLLKRGTGSGERGTEVWERVVSGNLHKIQYGR